MRPLLPLDDYDARVLRPPSEFQINYHGLELDVLIFPDGGSRRVELRRSAHAMPD